MAPKFFHHPLLLLLLAILAAPALLAPAAAITPDEMLTDPALEARAREISRQLRCVVCQSQSIDDSDAPLAKDMRVLVRERLTAGDSDTEIIEFLVDRYGDYILLKPPMQTNTIFLWAAPMIIFLFGGGLAWFYVARMQHSPTPNRKTPNSETKTKP